MTERDLADLGVFRIPVPVPFPQAGGPVNVYAIEEKDGGLLLWDSGLGSPDGMAALEEGFRGLGRRFDEVRRIVISHAHVDHYGAARFVEERAGREIPAYAHPADASKMVEGGPRSRERFVHYGPYLVKLGVPMDVLLAIGAMREKSQGLARRVRALRPIGDGERVETKHLSLRVLHMPGHTPGLLCLHEEARRLFLSADHLLEKVSPNPIIELGPNGEEGFFRPLLAYVDSVRRMRALDLDLVLPGHGPPFSGHQAVIDRLLAFYEKRQARIREVLAEGPEGKTAYEVSRALFPAARSIDAFLTVSETIANLEALEHRGEVSRSLVDGVYRFR
jgi:glyoxylase-like metal-dependent hydrolase (beta-lactamase superfamily II)